MMSLLRRKAESGMGPHGRSAFRYSSVVETLAVLAVLIAANRIFGFAAWGYLDIQPHPFWAIVVLIAIRYPFREGLVCASLPALAYALFVVFPSEGDYFFLTTNLFSDYKEPILFVVVGGVISGYTEHLTRRTEALRDRLQAREEEMASLGERNRATQEALNKLELRIAGQSTSMVDLFGSLSQTRSMTPDEIKLNLMAVLRQYLNMAQGKYYDVERGQPVRGRLLSEDGRVTEVGPPAGEDFILTEAQRLKHVAYLGQFAQSADFDAYRASSLLAGPLLNDSGEAIGLVGIEKMPFLDYNPHSFKLFGTILSWWASALDEGIRLQTLREESVFNEELGLYNFAYFWGRLNQEFRRARRFSIPLSLSLIRIDQFDGVAQEKQRDLVVTVARVIARNVTELEMASCYKTEDTVALVFPFLMAPDAEEKVRKIAAEINAFGFQPYQDADERLALSWSVADFQIGMEDFGQLITQAESGLETPCEKAGSDG